MAKVKIYADELSAPNSEKLFSNNPITLSESKPLADMDGTDLVTKDNLVDAAYKSYKVPLTNVSTYSINWQSDILPGTGKTYAELLGNNPPKPFVWVLDGGGGYVNPGTQPYVVPMDADTLLTVTFDFGLPVIGYIVF